MDTLGTRFGGNTGGFSSGGGGGGTFFQTSSFGPGFPFNGFQGSVGGTSFQSTGPDTLGTRTSFHTSSSSAGGAVPDTLGTRTNFQSASAGGNTAFQSSGPGGSFQSASTSFQGTDGGGTFYQSSTSGGPGGAQNVAFTGTGIGPLGVRSSFQSASATGDVGSGPSLAVNSAVAQAQAQLQNAYAQINRLQAALANLG